VVVRIFIGGGEEDEVRVLKLVFDFIMQFKFMIEGGLGK
jgi:hypothetical protein